MRALILPPIGPEGGQADEAGQGFHCLIFAGACLRRAHAGKKGHVVGESFIIKTVFGQEPWTAAVGAYAVLAGIQAEHCASARGELVVVGFSGQLLRIR